MAKHTFDIPNGPKLDGEPQTSVTLGELTGVQYVECLEEAEKAIQVPIGMDDKGHAVMEFQLIPSPAKMTLSVLRARIQCIGEIKAPVSDAIWSKLSAEDINTMLAESSKFDDALSGVTQQGEH